MTGAVQNRGTFLAAATSAAKRARNTGSLANSERMTFTTTRRPARSSASRAVPIPPDASLRRMRYSPSWSEATTAVPVLQQMIPEQTIPSHLPGIETHASVARGSRTRA
jgi:hypothetical protein